MRLREGALTLVLAAAFVVGTAPVQAHHSVANFWQADKNVSMTGVVTKVLLVNPHPSLFLDLGDGGKLVAILGQGVSGLAKFGITKEMLAPGTKLTLEGHPPKAEGGATKGLLVNAFTLPDGKRIVLGEGGLGLGTP